MKHNQNTPNELPEPINVYPHEVFGIPKNAISVGLRLHELGWSRRVIIDRLQLRLEFYLDIGGVYKDHLGEIFSIDEDSVQRTFSGDPSCKWLSTFPKRCAAYPDWDYQPKENLWPRFQILDAALRTPPFGLAI